MNTDIDSLAVTISDAIKKRCDPSRFIHEKDPDFLDSFLRGHIDQFLWHEAIKYYDEIDQIESLPNPDKERIKLLFATAKKLSRINHFENLDSAVLFHKVKSIYTSQ